MPLRRHPEVLISRLNSPACTYPCPTLRLCPYGHRRMARGHRGSLLLRCRALSSPPSCRFIPALSAFAGGRTFRLCLARASAVRPQGVNAPPLGSEDPLGPQRSRRCWMPRGPYMTEAEKTEIWDRHGRGEPLYVIARQIGRSLEGVRHEVNRRGGVRPQPRRRPRGALS